MTGGALGTYAATLIVLGASLALGGGIVAACGGGRWSWTAPAIGLAAATVLAWWSIRLPGHATTALVVLAVASALGARLAATRLDGLREALARGLPPALLALAACSIPFVVEGHFGVLGTGFNVDMSQHLFAADWLSDPSPTAPGIYEQGYPLGPHALAAATGGLTGNLATAFSGVTIALPVIVALTALAAVEGWSRGRAYVVAAMTAFAYLAASYLAQGSFKELFEIALLLGFALWLSELNPARGWTAALPGAVLAAGALYSYSGPGLAWPAGTLVLWAAIGLIRGRAEAGTLIRRSLPFAAAAALAAFVLAAPELDRIIDFGGSVGTVTEATDGSAGNGGGDGPRSVADRAAKGPKFDNDLGNLFGQISPLEAFGVWPSGDFRVAPGDGAVPAVVFYAGALLGAFALGLGVAAAARRGEAAILAALAAAAAIWLAARIGSTPYTTAKALAMISPLVGLVAAKGLLDNAWLGSVRDRSNLPRAALALLVVTASGFSAALALANAPVGPGTYSAGVGRLSDDFAGQPTLLLAPPDVMADEHGSEFYGWELREASASCVASTAAAGAGERAPNEFHFVLTVDGEADPPYVGLVRAAATDDGVTLWRRADGSAKSTLLIPLADGAIDCEAVLG